MYKTHRDLFQLCSASFASEQAGLESVVPPDEGIHGSFLCLPCYNQLERAVYMLSTVYVEKKMKETVLRLKCQHNYFR